MEIINEVTDALVERNTDVEDGDPVLTPEQIYAYIDEQGEDRIFAAHIEPALISLERHIEERWAT
jgi:hypothetical protein